MEIEPLTAMAQRARAELSIKGRRKGFRTERKPEGLKNPPWEPKKTTKSSKNINYSLNCKEGGQFPQEN